ncbi:MAG: hypothetical protein Q9162_001747 [Coniocarpon cinnabarinum]
MKFREHADFKSNIGPVRDAKGMKGMEMFHVTFTPGGASTVQQRGGVGQEEVLNPHAGPKNPPATTKEGNTTKYTYGGREFDQ